MHLTQTPLTPGEEKTLDAYVLEQHALDPFKNSGLIAADATLEDLIPGKIVTSKDVSASKARQDLIQQSNEPETSTYQRKKKQSPSTAPQPKGDSPMSKRSAEEIAAIKSVIEANPDKKPKELVEIINSKKIATSGPVKYSQVNFMRYQMNHRKGRTTVNSGGKRVSRKTSVETVAASTEHTFDGFLQKLEDLAAYGKKLREVQKEKVAAFLA